jgi:hypothetical protein
MKTSAIIRIVCWLVIACVLVGALLWGINRGGGTGFSFNFFPIGCVSRGFGELSGFSPLQGDVGKYSADNSYDVAIGSIDTLKIEWVDGSIRVTPYEGDVITFRENASGGIPEKYALRYAVNGGTLTIQYCGIDINWNNNWWSGGKTLEVLVPKTLADNFSGIGIDAASADIGISDIRGSKLGFNTVSGTVNAANIEADTLTIDTTSGEIEANTCTVDTVKTNTVSGTVRLDGRFNKVSSNTVSGSVSITSSASPSEVDVDTISGSSMLMIPENNGFTARYESVSGGFSCDFPVTSANNKAVYGDGSADFTFDSVSGEIRIGKIG